MAFLVALGLAACDSDPAAPWRELTIPTEATAEWSSGTRVEGEVARARWGFHLSWERPTYEEWLVERLQGAGFRILERSDGHLAAQKTLEADILSLHFRSRPVGDFIEVEVEMTGRPW